MSGQPDLTFFTDRDLGKQFPSILKAGGIQVEAHFDNFTDQTKDEIWLSEIGKRGWYAVSHDKKIRYKPNEIAAVKKFGVGLFIVIGKAPFSELADNFVVTLPRIKKFIGKHQRPFIAKIYRADIKSQKTKTGKPGRVVLWESFL